MEYLIYLYLLLACVCSVWFGVSIADDDSFQAGVFLIALTISVFAVVHEIYTMMIVIQGGYYG